MAMYLMVNIDRTMSIKSILHNAARLASANTGTHTEYQPIKILSITTRYKYITLVLLEGTCKTMGVYCFLLKTVSVLSLVTWDLHAHCGRLAIYKKKKKKNCSRPAFVFFLLHDRLIYW